MDVTLRHDSNLGLPQFHVPDEPERLYAPLLGWIASINQAIQGLANSWPWTHDMYCGHDPYVQVCASTAFLCYCERSKSINKSRTSYGLKHDVERASGIYVSEGCFNIAAKLHNLKLQATPECRSFYLNLRIDQAYYDRLEVMYATRTSRLSVSQELASAV